MNIGKRIKDIRKQNKLTLKELSTITGLSISYLSNIERDVNSPTLLNLQKICEALRIDIPDLLHTDSDNKIIVKKNLRREIFRLGTKVKYESTTEGKEKIKGVCMTIKGGEDFEEISWGHHSDEFGIIAKGSLEINMNNRKYILNEGDSIYIYSHTPHRFRSLGKEDCVSYWVYIEDKQAE